MEVFLGVYSSLQMCVLMHLHVNENEHMVHCCCRRRRHHIVVVIVDFKNPHTHTHAHSAQVIFLVQELHNEKE